MTQTIQEPCGILNICKPDGCTSRDVVDVAQRALSKSAKIKKFKMGHAGTLDPMATGVLLVCVGRATRLIPVIHEFSKTYEAGFTLGQTSDTDDSTGEIQVVNDVQPPSQQQLLDALNLQVGVLMQTPPAFSAVKIQGRRAYKAARAGQEVLIEPRPVTVHSICLLDYEYPHLNVRICCGSGTYIRSIARDIGQHHGTGALMHSLQRTDIGPFTSKTGIAPEDVSLGAMLPVEKIFESSCAKYVLSDDNIQQLRHGRKLHLNLKSETLDAVTTDGRFAARLRRCDGEGNSDEYIAEINWVPQWFQ